MLIVGYVFSGLDTDTGNEEMLAHYTPEFKLYNDRFQM